LHSIIVADGDIHDGPALDHALAAFRAALATGEGLVVAADGGALKAVARGLRSDVVVGDGDSLSPDRAAELRATGIEVIVHPVEKDQSDTELAVGEALARGATTIVLIGAIGGHRFEHTVANLLLLSLPQLADVDARLVDGPTTARVIGHKGSGNAVISGSPTDYVSLLPLSGRVEGVTTRGLRYPLSDATLTQGPARGLSNELSASEAGVTTRSGRLAVIHTIRTEELNHEAN
jgi:thiamine pyrophosphokinase